MNDFETKPVPTSSDLPGAKPELLEKGQPTSPFLMPSNRPPGKWQSMKDFLRTNKWYVVAIILGLGIISVLAYFAFRPNKAAPPGEANVSVTIDAPENAASGSEIIYTISLRNDDRNNLVQVELELVYPSGINYVSSSPKAENLSGSLFAVPDLTPGVTVPVKVKVTAQGDINDEKEVTARLHYHYSNFNSEFIKEASATTRLVASDVALQLSGPQTTTNAQVVTYDLTYANNSDHDISNARIKMNYPGGFSFADSNPKTSLGQDTWNVGNLAKGQNGKISFQGSFKSASAGESQTFTAEFQVLDEQGSYYTQASADFITAISSLPLVVTQALDNGSNIVKPGDTLRYTIKYQNNGSVAATGVNIVASIDPKSIDLTSLQAQGGEVSNNTITWNAGGVSNLEHLSPNESGTVNFIAKVKNPAVKDSSKNITINSTVKIKANEYQDFLPGNDLALKVSSPATLSGSVKYVSGQLPLKVGQSTTMAVTMSLTNSTNDFNNAILTGFIPSGAVYDAASVTAKEAGSVSYDSATGKITWKLGVLPAHTGDFNPARSLSFNVRVTPGANQAGQELTLFRNITFVGKDIFTAQDINLKTDDLTSTDMPNGFDTGRVQP
jgi:uncharacterized repeat protein (TIGR01451 family)